MGLGRGADRVHNVQVACWGVEVLVANTATTTTTIPRRARPLNHIAIKQGCLISALGAQERFYTITLLLVC